MSLRDKVNHYYLLCQGVGISVPPNMVSRIVDFAIGSIATRSLNKLQEAIQHNKLHQATQEQLDHIKQELIKYKNRLLGTRVEQGPDFTAAFMYLDFGNWKTSLGDPETIYDALAAHNITGIYCEVKYGGSREGLAMWEASKLKLTLFVNLPEGNTLAEFQKIVNKMDSFEKYIESSVIHELTHFVQNLGNFMKRTEGRFGLPPKKVRNKLIDPYGRYKRKNPESDVGSTPHAFIDAEFYTNLSDSVQTFNHFADKMNNDLKRLFFKIFIGIASPTEINKFLDENKTVPKIVGTAGYWWFRDLKSDWPRWKLAVKKFVEAAL